MEQKQNASGAPTGNKNAVKLRTPELRQQAYREFCAHLANGRSPRSFTFEHPDFTITGQTVERMIRDDVEFPPIHKEIAEAKGFGYWEGVVIDSATGKNRFANTASLQMIMRNKFGWDREDKNRKEIDTTKLQALADFFAPIHTGSKALEPPTPAELQDPGILWVSPQSPKTDFP